MNLKGNNDEYGFAGTHEYTLVYSRNYKAPVFNNLRIKDKSKIDEEWETDEHGYYKLGTLKGGGENGARELRPNLYYPIYLSKNGTFSLIKDDEHSYEVLPISNGKDMTWRWSKEKLLNEPYNICVEFEDGEFKINRKIRPLNNIPSIKPKTLFYKESYSSGNGIKIIKDLFGARLFNYSKPLDLMMDLIEICTNKDDIILDFFSGSATTAHSIMQLNFEDAGNRKCISIQLPELTKVDSEAYKAGYKNICEIGKERIRRAGEQIVNNRKDIITIDKNDLRQRTPLPDGTFEDKYATKVIEACDDDILDNLDIGFKVFKLDTSNLKKWNNAPTKDANEVAKRIQLSLDYLENDRTELDLVYEIMLKYGLDLTLPITKSSNGKAYIVEAQEYKLLICSEMNLTLDDIESFANESVGTYLFADRCFADDNLLINTQEILKSRNKEMRLF